MHHGQHVKRVIFCKIGKKTILLLSLGFLFAAMIGTTMALLTAESEVVTNTFAAGAVACQVNSDYSVTNTAGNKSNDGTLVDAYIRAAVVINWSDGQNVYGTPPKVSFELGENWVKSGEYYYYTEKVAAGQSTTKLITGLSCSSEQPSGYTLSVQILAEAIQADGVSGNGTTKAVVEAWGVDPGALQ